MPTPPALPTKLGKSALSAYLRTNCDRELYFSLFKANARPDIEKAGMPPPLTARPNIELITKAGIDFEEHEMGQLLSQIGPTHVIHKKTPKKPFADLDLLPALNATLFPAFYLQPALEPETVRKTLLCTDFNLPPADEAIIPTLAGLRPDVIIARDPTTLHWEVLPTGKRKALPLGETRIGLSVIDIKNVLEGNKSYAAEVVLYAIILSRWLIENRLSGKFFVSDDCYLWTHKETSALAGLPTGTPIAVQLAHLLENMERVEFAVVAPSVVRFFQHDLPRVIRHGNTNGWQAIDYHVGSRCSSCDWLGHERWLSSDDKTTYFTPHKDWYCLPAAKFADHLSQLPNISKGARKVLEANTITTLSAVSALLPTAAALRAHTILKRDRSNIPQKAQAIVTGTPSTDATAVLSGLAKDVQLQIAITVNFDSAAGLLTGIAARATLFMPFGSTPSIYHLDDFAVVIEDPTNVSEWTSLHSFLSAFAKAVQDARTRLGGTLPKTQLLFWEERQFHELCESVGRHIPQIFAVTPATTATRLLQALAWLFPPDELLERDGAVSPYIVFVGDLANRVLRLPAPHAFTLRQTHEAYHHPSLPPHKIDLYFVDPLGNGMPRERIFEVWRNASGIRRGAVVVTKGQAIADCMKALKSQSHAIASISAQLRNDFKGNLRGSAKQLDTTLPSGANSVALDAKLWIQWSEIEKITTALERKAEYTLPSDVLEATYKALVLTTRTAIVSPTRGIYDVSPDSSQCKLDDSGAFFVLGRTSSPGFPLETPCSLGLPPSANYTAAYYQPIHGLIRCQIHALDRIKMTAEVEIRASSNNTETVAAFNALVTNGLLPLNGDLFLMEGKPYDDSSKTREILQAIGNPACAAPDPHALKAMARTKAPKAGKDPVTPAARVLWQADALANTPIRTPANAVTLAARAKTLMAALDPSQETAIRATAEKQLSLIWGPPGTGKTTTLTAYLLAIIAEAIACKTQRRILLTGPNYRAVEVLVHKLIEALNPHTTLAVDVAMVYSRSRTLVPFPIAPAAHITGGPMNLGIPPLEANLLTSYRNATVSIFGTAAQNIPKLIPVLTGTNQPLVESFDLVIIDESSQVPVTLALRPLATLKTSTQIVIAGDPKQMPPVQPLEPPVGAEHLVRSIHNYIITRFPTVPQQELLFNYRSGQDLVDFAKTLGYPSGLKSVTPARRLNLHTDPNSISLPPGLPVSKAWADLLDPAKVTCTLLHEDTQSSQANLREAKMVAAIAYTLRKCADSALAPSSLPPTPFTDKSFFEQGIGVVTPHKAQRALVLAELAQLFPSVPSSVLQQSVDTVEKFQGGERHCILVSFGVGDVDVIQGEEEFLLQLERANVAISRAMAKCIVIMPQTLAYHLPDESRVSKTAVALKSYIEEFCGNRRKHTMAGLPDIEVRWH